VDVTASDGTKVNGFVVSKSGTFTMGWALSIFSRYLFVFTLSAGSRRNDRFAIEANDILIQ